MMHPQRSSHGEENHVVEVFGREDACILFVALMAPPSLAHAYIDPGSGSLLLQLLVAGGIAAVIRFRAFLRASIGRLFGARKK